MWDISMGQGMMLPVSSPILAVIRMMMMMMMIIVVVVIVISRT